MISELFTNGDDDVLVTLDETYSLSFLGGNDRLVVRAGHVTATMGDGNDVVRIENGSARVYGQNGADTFDIFVDGVIKGGSGNDLFNVRGGANHSLTGGYGGDRFNFRADTANVRVNGSGGIDVFEGNSRSISGSLFGGAGNDRFLDFGNHGGRAVTLLGGPGNDLYRLDPNSPANILEHLNEGVDTVQIYRGTDYVLTANVENLAVLELPQVPGGAIVSANELSNRIIGSEGDDTIRGLGGNDVLIGQGGLDHLVGGDGDDRLVGGAWNDWIESGSGHDTIVYNSVSDAPSGVAWDYEFIADWDPMDTIDLSAIDANPLIPGDQAFEFAGYSFGEPYKNAQAGTLVISGFGGELYILGYIAGGDDPDLVISLWSAMGEGGLTVDNLIL